MKRIWEQRWDEHIRAMAKEDTHPNTEHLEQRLERLTEHLTDVQPIRRKPWRKMVAIVAAAVVVSVTAMASSGIIESGQLSWVGHTLARPDYSKLPTAEQCIEDIGYEPILMQEFSNGYVFDNGSITTEEIQNEGRTQERFRSVMFRYRKDGDEVLFSQDRYQTDVPEKGRVLGRKDGIEYRYTHYTNKVVPPDYTLTEKDKEQEASGELVFSYGSAEVSINQVQHVDWSDGDMHYQLMEVNGSLSAQELLNMAQEMMDQ